MNTSTKTLMDRTAAILLIMMLLFVALPVWPAGAVSLDITSVASGTWEATAWPNTQRSGTITVTSGSSTVTGSGTAFTAELSAGIVVGCWLGLAAALVGASLAVPRLDPVPTFDPAPLLRPATAVVAALAVLAVVLAIVGAVFAQRATDRGDVVEVLRAGA